MQRFDLFRMQPDFAVGSGAELAFSLKADIAFLVQLSLHLKPVFFNGDSNVFQRRVFGGEDMSVQDVGERLRVHGDFSRSNLQLERVLVVKHRYVARLRGRQAAANIDQVHSYLVGKVIHHVVHLHFHRAAVLARMERVLAHGQRRSRQCRPSRAPRQLSSS